MSTVDDDQIERLRRLWDQYGRLLTVRGARGWGGGCGRDSGSGSRWGEAAGARRRYGG